MILIIFINSFNLKYDYLAFKNLLIQILPKKWKIFKFSSKSKKLKFWELIDPKVSEDFLLECFINV